MVDYNSNVPTVQPMQQPNMMQAYGQMQQIQANRMAFEENARQRREEQMLRGIEADPSSPEYVQQVARISPKLGMQALNLQRQNAMFTRQGEAAERQGQLSMAELALKNSELLTKKGDQLREAFAKVAGFPDDQQPTIYANIIAQLPENMRGLYSPVFSKSALRAAASTTAEITQSLTPQFKNMGGRDVRVAPGGGDAEEILVKEAPRFPTSLEGTALPNVPGVVPVGPGAAAPGDAQAVTNNMRPVVPNVNQLAGRTVPASQLASEAEANKQKQELETARLKALQDPAKQLELRKEVGGAKKDVEGVIGTLTTALSTVNKIKAFSDEDLNRELGYVGANTPAASAQSKAVRTAFNELKGTATAMAKADAGKIGSMQVQEWGILRDQLASLDYATMTPKELKEQIGRIEARAKTLMDQAKRSYSETYGSTAKELGGFSEVPEGRKSVGITQAEYNALPKGATYTDPNGIERTKR